MKRVYHFLGRLSGMSASEPGQGLAEYALILAFIALVCIGALSALGIGISTSPGFTDIPSAL